MQFEQRFAPEEACYDYVFQLRWPDGFQCSRCRGKKYWLTSHKLYYCVHYCRHTPCPGTFFKIKLPNLSAGTVS
ncbi:MAG: hypothetical protein COY53_05405 [Elusimicrobia bacterium CG_4_10_14_0_8_um_filter_37_32]|nr:MAG: hypothetical protein COS17_02115 [Elusimicrobia bacterium CG02_land_8_20_14_3_00_37_13]PIZ13336.1 MAG: hypothetical protein COY53_05405 [Elusimicrobia bacterium CG_4_10_14_0_8_um_filter_37_32]